MTFRLLSRQNVFCFAPSTDTAFGSFILLGLARVYKSLPILVPTQSHTLRKEFTTTISCDILAIQLTFDLM